MKILIYKQTDKNSLDCFRLRLRMTQCVWRVIFAKAKPEAIQKFIVERHMKIYIYTQSDKNSLDCFRLRLRNDAMRTACQASPSDDAVCCSTSYSLSKK
jgi:hypothetical protein